MSHLYLVDQILEGLDFNERTKTKTSAVNYEFKINDGDYK